MKRCPECQQFFEDTYQFCPHCGTVFDARLGRVREDETQVGVQGRFDDLIPLRGGIEAALHAVDLFDLLDHLAVLHAAQDHVVQSALLVDDVAHALRERLDDLHGGIEHAGFVHAVDHPIDGNSGWRWAIPTRRWRN